MLSQFPHTLKTYLSHTDYSQSKEIYIYQNHNYQYLNVGKIGVLQA